MRLAVFMRVLAFGVALTTLVSPHAASAQTTPPDGADIQRRLQIDPAPQARPEGPIATPPSAGAPPPGAESLTFDFRDVRFIGATAFDDATLRGALGAYLGRTITLADAFAAADEISAFYRRNGLVLSRAVLPEQDIEDSLVIRVVEGYVARIDVQGEARDLLGLIGDGPAARAVLAARPIDGEALERLALVVNNLAGVVVRSVIQPESNGPAGAAVLTLVTENDRFAAFATANNYGSGFIGPYQFSAGGSVANMAGLFEKITVRGVVADPLVDPTELGLFQGAVEMPIGADGLKVGVSGSHAIARPGEGFQNVLDFRTTSSTVDIDTSYPIIRSRRQNLLVSGGFSYFDSRSVALDVELSEDRIRTVDVGVSYDFADPYGGINIAQGAVVQGVPAFNATETGMSRADAVNDYTNFRLYAARYQNLGVVFDDSRLSAFAAVEGQVTRGRAPSRGEFAVGGARIGRGYDPSEISGEHGVAGKLELRFTDTIPAWRGSSYELFGFLDAGVVYDGTDSVDSAALASVGAGVRLDLFDHVSAEFYGAKPIADGRANPRNGGDEGGGSSATRFLFSLSTRY